jgi:hypothetical protein
MSWIDVAGITLSAAAALMCVGLVAHSFSTRTLNRGGRSEAGSYRGAIARWAWPVILSLSFFVGFYGLPLRRVIHSAPPTDSLPQATQTSETRRQVDQRLYTLRAPFYVRQRTDEQLTDAEWHTTERVSVLQLPWIFLGVSSIYLLFGSGRRPRGLGLDAGRSRRARLSLM